MRSDNTQKKITISQLKRYLPINPPPLTHKLPTNITRYISSPTFQNLSITQQNQIMHKYNTVYRNYFSAEDLVKYIGSFTNNKYTDSSINRALCNSAQRYGVIDWYKFLRKVMEKQNTGKLTKSGLAKEQLVGKVKHIFKSYLGKRKIWRGVEQVADTKRNIDGKVLDQLCKQSQKQVKQFIERNRVQCQQQLYNFQTQHPKTVTFIALQHLMNKQMQMYLDRKKVIYLYLSFDKANRGFFKTSQLMSQLLVVPKPKPVKKQSYYLTDVEELMTRVRTQMNAAFYSAHEMENDFWDFYAKRKAELGIVDDEEQDEDYLNQDIFYDYISLKCDRKYSRYMLNKVHKRIKFRSNVHFLYNKPNLPQLSKLVSSLLQKKRKKRILKKQNNVFYSYRTIILYLITRCKHAKVTKQVLNQFLIQNQQLNSMYKSFYCVWRVYPNVINVDRIKRECKLNPLAAYFKLRRTDEEYDKMYEFLLDLLPEGEKITYNKLEEKINMNLEFVLDLTKIKPLPLDKYDEVDYREAIQKIFQPDFELDMRAYIHRKVSEKAYALWKAYLARKQARLKAQRLAHMAISNLIPNPKSSIESSNSTTKVLRKQKSKSSLNSKKPPPINPQSLQIAQHNLTRILNELPLPSSHTHRQFHTDKHVRYQLCIKKHEQYEYRTLTPRYVMHPIAGTIGMGSNLMFLRKGKMETIKIKFFYKPGIQIIDFATFGNQIVLLTSYFVLEFYSLSQDSPYSYQSLQLLDELKTITFAELDTMCQNRVYSRFPIFLRSGQKQLTINTSVINNQILIVDPESNSIIIRVKFTQKQHVLNINSTKILDFISKSSNKYQLYQELIREFNKDEIDIKAFKDIFANENDRLEGEGKTVDVTFSQSEIKSFVKNMETFTTPMINCILKQQLGLLKQHKMPQSLSEVLLILDNYMIAHNLPLSSIIAQLDRENQGYISIKSLKDMLLRIGQQAYSQNEKQIDPIIRKMAVSKHVDYDKFIEIMSAWKYKIWERPYMVIRDHLFIRDLGEQGVIVYVLEGYSDVFIKNVADGQIFATLKGHSVTPAIYYIPQSSVLITGGHGDIRMWRVYSDLIGKYDESPPWQINPFVVLPNAHNDLITSIIYLSRSHIIVTTSLDSTAKFWQINPTHYLKQKNSSSNSNKTQESEYLVQVKRFYSNEHIFLSSKSQQIWLPNETSLQQLSLARVSKQINQNNKLKYETKIEVYQIENMKIESGPSNIFMELPPLLKRKLEQYTDVLGRKKNVLLAKTVGQRQALEVRNLSILANMEQMLYQAVKGCFIFADFSRLYAICGFLVKKGISGQIVRVIFQKFGVGIPKENQYCPLNNTGLQLIKPFDSPSQFVQQIQLSQQQFQPLQNRLQSYLPSIAPAPLLQTITPYLDMHQFERFQQLLEKYIKQTTPQPKLININIVLSWFKTYQLSSELDKLYAILRSVSVIVRQRGMQIWNFVSFNKTDLEKKRKVSIGEFEKFMAGLGIGESKVRLLVAYLGKNKYVTLDDVIYYTKLAWEIVGIDMNQSNFSNVFMRNSRLLQSNLEMFKLDSGIEVQQTEFEKKIKTLQDSVVNDGSLHQSMSRKSSKKGLREAESISESHSVQKDSESREKKRSVQKSQFQKRQQIGGNSMPMSSSNSRVSLSHESNAKDEYSRQILTIVKKINEMLKNQGKSLWDITSLSVPEFMDNNLVSETQYFSILSGINSPIYLRDKLKLMGYIMRESDQYSSVDLNILFQLFTPTQNQRWNTSQKSKQSPTLPGQKYITSFLISKLTENNLILEHSLSQNIFHDKQQLTIEQLLLIMTDKPFQMLPFCIKQLEILLTLENKSAFTLDEIKYLLEERVKRFNIKMESKEVSFIQEIVHRVDNRGVKLEELFPKNATGVVDFKGFCQMVKEFFVDKDVVLQNQFVKIVLDTEHQKQQKQKQKQKQKHTQSPSRFSKQNQKKLSKSSKHQSHSEILKKGELKHKQLLSYITRSIQALKQTSNTQKDAVKKFLKALQSKKLSLFTFFISLDRNRNYFINQIQFVAGLAEMNVNENFWNSIKKRYSKKLYYYQLINYLVQGQFVAYKCVDSELEAAMMKFVKRFVRNDDIQAVFDRVRDKEGQLPFNSTFKSFEKSLKTGNLFKQQQIFYIFSAFANADSLKSSNFSNDSIIKDPSNVHKSFNFKMFTDVINSYRNQNITKTPHYKLCHFFKKRSISLTNQFTKWLQRNKKQKQIAQALKTKEYILPRELYQSFLKQLGTQLSQKQLKQMLSTFPNMLQFATFNQKLEQIYKKGNSNVQMEQINVLLQHLYKRIIHIDVTVYRLFLDFTADRLKMNMTQFADMIRFLDLGFTKIHVKMVFGFVDVEKKGFITVNQLANALQDAGQTLDKEEDEVELDYIIEKLIANKDKILLKPSRISYNLQRAYLIFTPILTRQQIGLLHKNAVQQNKGNQLTEQKMQQFIGQKYNDMKARQDKKYKQLILNFLKLLRRANLQVKQAYHYFCRDNNTLTKNKFLLCYQSLGLKSTIVEINALYSYLDEGKKGTISIDKWEDKLNVIQFQRDNTQGVSGEELQVFYKVKLVLADIYLAFVRKLYKSKQIASYFDIKGTGCLTYQQFMTSLQNLGLNFDQPILQKLTNYLDKPRSGQIQINNLLYQLQNCLPSKTKLILSTKTSCIFKQKIHLIAQKQSYFIQRLVNGEHFVSDNAQGEVRHNKLESCILVMDFVEICKDFGIVLQQDQFADVQRNFKFDKDNLQLYPLYFMFVNIFKTNETTLTPDTLQRNRFQKLFQTLIKTGLTMKVFEKMQTIKQATLFISQLKIFTPIQIKLIIQSVTVPGTHLIDVQLLTNKTRDSFLQSCGNWFRGGLIEGFGGAERGEVMREWLREQLDPGKVVQILKASTGRITLPTFESLLLSLSIVLKKSTVQQLFSEFNKGQDYILIQQLLQQNKKEIKIENILNLSTQAVYEKHCNVLLDHICKSLDFKGVCLQQALEKYFINFGFVCFADFYLFLKEIGFDYQEKQYDGVVGVFLDRYKKQTKLAEIKVTQLEKMMKQRHHIPQKQTRCKNYIITNRSLQKLYRFLSSKQRLVQDLCKQLQQLNTNLSRIPASLIYAFIRKQLKNQQIFTVGEKQLVFFMNLLLAKQELNLQQFKANFNEFIDGIRNKIYGNSYFDTEEEEQDVVVLDPSRDSFKKVASSKNKGISVGVMGFEEVVKKICQRNFIHSYQKIIDNFEDQTMHLSIPILNKNRLSLTLILQNLLQNDYLLFIKPKLSSSTSVLPAHLHPVGKKSVFLDHGGKFNMKIVANLLVDKQEYIESRAFYKINDKYYGMLAAEKKEFQEFAAVANILHSDTVFLRAKNYYLWEIDDRIMPKQAVNFRWKYIPITLLKICQQLQNLEQYGYAVPHLRWRNLHPTFGISHPPFPTHSDFLRNLSPIAHPTLLIPSDPYCAPQLFISPNKITLNINTWILGCLIYEFIWGHEPNSFIIGLLEYINSRHCGYQLNDVLKMQELPSDFRYVPWNWKKMKDVLAFQHQLKADGIPDDFQNNTIYFGMRGIFKNLEILYGKEEMYYRKQFEVMQKLHQLIAECLNPNPQLRPSLKQAIHSLASLLQQQDYKNYRQSEYISTLSIYTPTQTLNETFIDPLKLAFLNRIPVAQIRNLIEIFYQQLTKIKEAPKIHDNYIIPKRYPWPQVEDQVELEAEGSKMGTFSRSVRENGVGIRMSGGYSSVCLIFNQNALQMLVTLFVRYIATRPQESQRTKVFEHFCRSLSLIFEMLRSYQSPFVGYIPNILQSFIQLYYLKPFTFASHNSAQTQALQAPILSATAQRSLLSIIRPIIYLDGSANIEYLPLYHFMIDNKRYKQLFQYFYASTDLRTNANHKSVQRVDGQMEIDKRVLAISYFRDRVYEDQYWEIVRYLNIDVLMLQLLKVPELTHHILLFLQDFTQFPQSLQSSLPHSPLFYLHLSQSLTQSISPMSQKQSTIKILTNLLCHSPTNKKLLRHMNEPSYSILRDILKLIIEPVRDTPAHQEYLLVVPTLLEFVRVGKEVEGWMRVIGRVEGGEAVIEEFWSKRFEIKND